MKLELQQKPKQSYKYLTFLVMLYATSNLLLALTYKKVILIQGLGIVPISIFMTGIYLVISDIIAEVYGYKEAQKALISLLVIYTLFTGFAIFIAHPSSPNNTAVAWSSTQDPYAFQFIFGDIPAFYIGVIVSALVGTLLNIYLISKWKILLKGRFFWLRSVGASGIAAFLYSVITTLFVGLHAILYEHALGTMMKIMIASFLAKIITLMILASPATLICAALKKAEKVDVYDYGVKYNPFKIFKRPAHKQREYSKITIH